MAERVPTEKQYEALRSFRVGSWAVLSSGRLRPLVRRGWLAPEDPKKDDRFLHITPKGLRALADAVERYGFPPFPRDRTMPDPRRRTAPSQYEGNER